MYRSGSDAAAWLPRSRCWFCHELAPLEWFSKKSFSSAFSYHGGRSRSRERPGAVQAGEEGPEAPQAVGAGVEEEDREETPPLNRDMEEEEEEEGAVAGVSARS